MIAHETAGWEILTALATTAAVVVALLLAGLPLLVRVLRRPKLRIVTGDVEPHCIPIPAPSGRISMANEVVVRLEVRNDGKTVAAGCWAKVSRRWRYDLPIDDTNWPTGSQRPYRVQGWHLVEEDPIYLRWSSLPFAVNRGAGVSPVVEVPRGHAEFAELVILDTAVNRLRVAADNELTGRSRFEASDAIGIHRWEVIVGAQALQPIVAVIEFRVDGTNFIRGIQQVEAPAGATDHRLFALLRGRVPES